MFCNPFFRSNRMMITNLPFRSTILGLLRSLWKIPEPVPELKPAGSSLHKRLLWSVLLFLFHSVGFFISIKLFQKILKVGSVPTGQRRIHSFCIRSSRMLLRSNRERECHCADGEGIQPILASLSRFDDIRPYLDTLMPHADA